MALIKEGAQVADPWTAVDEASQLPESGPILVPLELWQEMREALIARGGPLGVRLRSDQPPSAIEDDLRHLALVALEFPAFSDGRAYSYARILRDHDQFEGEIRAVGDVLLEQLHYMDRVGFNAFEIESDHAIEDWITACEDLNVWYQPSSDHRKTARDLRRGR